jgi:hypothetical protein
MMKLVSARVLFAVAGALLLLAFGNVRAQLSPGPLHETHAMLEGVENCTKCHSIGRQLAIDKCLVCHTRIDHERKTGLGLHSRKEYRECQLCHVDHQGRKYDLIYWEKGEKNFDHNLTGYVLMGKHQKVECRGCHQPKNIRIKEYILADKADIDKTFFGLDSACAGCHADEHRGQLSSICDSCHNVASWKPAPLFDHNRTKYALVAKHAQVPCEKCHSVIVDNRTEQDKDYVKYKDVAHAKCLDCHKDVHKGKFGPVCENCHNTAGWRVTDNAKFDHSKTKYPLVGKHIAVACGKCHPAGKPMTGLKFAACRDCHSDFHKGDFAKRPSAGACEECHTVNGYSPARFLIVQHDSTDYPLRGAHQAVPCSGCHDKISSAKRDTVYVFKFTSTRCLICHKNPHKDEVKKYVDEKGCEICHSDQGWQVVKFDHNLTKYPLEGKHATVACRKCHPQKDKVNAASAVTMGGAGKLCQSCHADIHLFQFAEKISTKSLSEPATNCARCHTPKDWKTLTFDHNRDSRYKLDGAHKNVPCDKCHRLQTSGDVKWVLYKPMELTCASCHGGTIPPEKKG